MKLTMLGTGHATVTKCYNTCFVFSSEEQEHFLVDAGGGNRILNQLNVCGIELEQIHDLFVTHEHLDHCLGVLWIIRMIGTKIKQGKYQGTLSVYCHAELVDKLCSMCTMTLQPDIVKLFGKGILFVAVDHGDEMKILDTDVTFFDIGSTKAKQYGFTMVTKDGIKLSCLGDEPYNPQNEQFVAGSDWLMHEAFCIEQDKDKYKPYEKHHSTVKDACRTAQRLGVDHLILYHMEESYGEKRKDVYKAEGMTCFTGDLQVAEDFDTYEIRRVLRFPGVK